MRTFLKILFLTQGKKKNVLWDKPIDFRVNVETIECGHLGYFAADGIFSDRCEEKQLQLGSSFQVRSKTGRITAFERRKKPWKSVHGVSDVGNKYAAENQR